MPEDPFAKERSFPSTRWSLIARVQDLDPELRRTALEELLRRYFPALRGYLVLCKGVDAERAEDLLQGFVADKILERDFFGHVEQQKGQFRQLLRRSLHHYLIDQIRQEQARGKRTGKRVSVEPEDLAAGGKPSPDVFDVAWARQVIVESARRMYLECQERGRLHVWGVFEQRILLPTLTNRTAPSYDQLVERFGFESPEQASNALITAKRRFKRTVEAVVAEYMDSQSEIDDEIRDLHQILASAGPLPLETQSDPSLYTAELPEEASVCINQTNPQSLAKILAFEHGEDEQSAAEDLGHLLRHQLAQPLSAILPNAILSSAAHIGEPGLPTEIPLETVGDLLRHPEPPLDLLVAANRLASDYARSKHRAVPPEICTVFYLSTIAAALLCHDERITESDDDVLLCGLKVTLQRPWLDDVTRNLLQQALSRLG